MLQQPETPSVDTSDRTTIETVARLAGVSISTVSRVLNNRDRVNYRTRERVLRAIRDLKYQPSILARGLAKQKTHNLGFVIPHLSDPYYMGIVQGVEEVASEQGYGLLVWSRPQSTLQFFSQQRVDGLVVVGTAFSKADLKVLSHKSFPVVVIQQDTSGGVPSFRVDNYAGARSMAEHLIFHGYTRIGYIAGSDNTPDNADRHRGLSDVLQEQGLEACRLAKGDYTYESGYRAAEELLNLDPRPQAIFAANDQMASAALLAAQNRGLLVPEDLAVVGFDDIPQSAYSSPPLTTVRQPTRDLGYLATRTLLSLIEGADKARPQRVELPVELIVRRSCGCLMSASPPKAR